MGEYYISEYIEGFSELESKLFLVIDEGGMLRTDFMKFAKVKSAQLQANAPDHIKNRTNDLILTSGFLTAFQNFSDEVLGKSEYLILNSGTRRLIMYQINLPIKMKSKKIETQSFFFVLDSPQAVENDYVSLYERRRIEQLLKKFLRITLSGVNYKIARRRKKYNVFKTITSRKLINETYLRALKEEIATPIQTILKEAEVELALVSIFDHAHYFYGGFYFETKDIESRDIYLNELKKYTITLLSGLKSDRIQKGSITQGRVGFRLYKEPSSDFARSYYWFLFEKGDQYSIHLQDLQEIKKNIPRLPSSCFITVALIGSNISQKNLDKMIIVVDSALHKHNFPVEDPDPLDPSGEEFLDLIIRLNP